MGIVFGLLSYNVVMKYSTDFIEFQLVRVSFLFTVNCEINLFEASVINNNGCISVEVNYTRFSSSLV